MYGGEHQTPDSSVNSVTQKAYLPDLNLPRVVKGMNQAMRISENKAWLLERLSACIAIALLLVFLVSLSDNHSWIWQNATSTIRILLTPHRSYELRQRK